MLRFLLIALAGCGPCSGDEWGTWTGYQQIDCLSDGVEPRLIDGLKPSEPASYFELRAVPGGGNDLLAQSRGLPCADANDKESCTAALAELSVTSGFPVGDCADSCSSYFLIHNSGGSTGVVTSLADLASYLAPIDTESEALLIVASSGYDISCANKNKGGVLLEHTLGTGVGVIATRYKRTCEPAEEWQYDLVVHPDGSIEVVQSKLWVSRDLCLD